MRRVVLTSILMAAAAMAQDDPAFRAGVTSVRVDALVTVDEKPLWGLQSEDFELLDEGEQRSVRAVWWEEMPLDIVLAVATLPAWLNPETRSKIAPMQWRLRGEAEGALLPLRPEDRVAVVSYGARPPNVDLPFTDDPVAIESAIYRASKPVAASPSLWSEPLAIEFAIQLFNDAARQDPNAAANRRRVIILISGPVLNTIPYPDEPIIQRLWEHDIILSSLDSRRTSEPANDPMRRPSRMYERLHPDNAAYRRNNPVHIARATGGEGLLHIDFLDPKDLLTRLRQRYVLWFDHPGGLDAGLVRRIEVRLSEEAQRRHPDADVSSRAGYLTRPSR